MANYTDNIQLLTSFSPYVKQQPIEEMYHVGVTKQAQYNEGVQKIQSYIDNVAGLDVSKDIHKQYLQSKLNELGGKLKTVAAGDFSNFQLVNNVMGMTNQIVKDPVIQNAVYSTQVIRKGQQDLEAAKQSGKSSPQNEAFWSKQIVDWQNDGDLNTRFNGSYISYTDIGKKLREVADKIHEIDSSIDIPFQRDSAGNVKYGDDGKPLVDDAMLRIKTKGKPAEKILANFMSSLDENDEQQLHIDSWYHYRGVTKDSFKNDIISNYANQKKLTQDQIVNLNLEIQTNPKLTDAEKAQKQAQVNTLNKQLNSGYFEQSMQQEIASIDNVQDLEAYKYKVYTQKYLTNLAKDMSYQSYQQEITSNPYAQMNMERLNLQARYDQMAQQQRQWAASFGFEQMKWSVEQQQKAEKEYKDKYGPTSPVAISSKEQVYTLDKLNGEIKGIQDEILQKKIQYSNLIPDKSITDPKLKEKYLDGLLEQYMKNPSTIDLQDNNMRKYLQERRQLELELSGKNSLAIETMDASKEFDQELSNLTSSEKPLITSTGRQIKPEDIIEVRNNFDKYFTGRQEATSGQRLQDKEFIANILYKQSSDLTLTPEERQVANYGAETGRKFYDKTKEIVNKKFAAQNEFLKGYYATEQPTSALVNMNIKSNQLAVDALIGQKTLQMSKNNIKGTFNPDEVTKMMKDKETKFTIERNNINGSGTLYLQLGSTTQPIEMTSSELSKFFPEVAVQNPLTTATKRATFSKKKTTNTFGGGDASNAVNAYYSGYDNLFPQLNNSKYASTVRFDIEADPSNNGSDNDGYQVRMYVYDGDKWRTTILNPKGYVSNAGIQKIFSGIGTQAIDDFLNKKR